MEFICRCRFIRKINHKILKYTCILIILYYTAVSIIHYLKYKAQFNFETSLWITNDSWVKETERNLFNIKSEVVFPLLPNYQNPCWYHELHENITSMYENNQFHLYSKSSKTIFYRYLKDLRDKKLVFDYKQKMPQFRCLPHVYLLGAPKCGTTDLEYCMRQHHQMFPGQQKEYQWWTIRHFGGLCNGSKLYISLSEYIELFDIAAQNILNKCPGVKDKMDYNPCVTFDASTTTIEGIARDEPWRRNGTRTMLPEIIFRVQPTTKLILILRNPSTRLYSDYYYYMGQDGDKKRLITERNTTVFHQDAIDSIQLMKNCIKEEGVTECAYSITIWNHLKARLHIGMYYVFLQEWLKVFSRNSILVLKTEEYSLDTDSVLQEVAHFLNLDPYHAETLSSLKERDIKNQVQNKTKTTSVIMMPETRKILDEFYKPYNDILADMLGDDKWRWNN